MTTATAEQTAQAEALREKANASRRQSLDSFARCDTDGALSQWASDSMAQLYTAQAEILDNGGTSEFTALFDIDGNMLDAREVQTRYGWSWVINYPGGTTTWFNESKAQNEERRTATNRRKGYYVGRISAPAWAAHRGNNGCLSVHVHVYRTTEGMDGVTVLDNGV